MSKEFDAFFKESCDKIMERYLFSVIDERLFQNVRNDLADYASMSGVKITLLAESGNREMSFVTERDGIQLTYKKRW